MAAGLTSMAKVLVVGNVAVGKTSVIRRFVYEQYEEVHRATVGVDFALKVLHYGKGVDVSVQLWDVAGQERFKSLIRAFYRDATAAIVVFDVTDRSSFLDAAMWKEDLDDKVRLDSGKPIPVMLLANKSDLLGTSSNAVTKQEVNKMVGASKFEGCYWTSAKTGANVEKACIDLVGKVLLAMRMQSSYSRSRSPPRGGDGAAE